MTRLLSGNEVLLLQGGQEYFAALVRAIDAARHSVYLETYIYNEDATGVLVTEALVRAAMRRVTVRVTVDGFGTRLLAPNLRRMLDEAGVELAEFRPDRLEWWPSRRRLRRMHRKLALVDDEVAFVGGINILDDFFDLNHGVLDAPRFDFAVQVRGPLVGKVAIAMMGQWLRVRWRHPRGSSGFGRKLLDYARRDWPRADAPHTVRAAFVVRDNLRNRTSIEKAYLTAIGQARHDVTISNAYFLPGRRFRKALSHAVKRGVRVRLLLQGRSEYVLQHYATRAIYDDLLAAGIEIHEYQRSFLHAKVAVVDEEWATVGSSNIDPFSLLLSREANVVVRDRIFAGQLRSALERAIRVDAVAIGPSQQAQRPMLARFFSWMAYGLLRFGVLLTGHSTRY